MKNASRNRFLFCFRPVVDMDLIVEPKAVGGDGSRNRQLLTLVGVVNNKDDMTMRPSTAMPSVPDTENSITIHRTGKKTFPQVVKAVVFEILLAKRVRDRKSNTRRSYSSKHDFPLSTSDELLDSDTVVGKGIHDTIPKSDSVSSSASSSSNSMQEPTRQQLQNNYCSNYSDHQEQKIGPKQGVGRGSCSNTAIIFWLLITLAVTIFWGKILAILFTSICLYVLPHYQLTGVTGNRENVTVSQVKKSRDRKKKVITEDCFERNYNIGSLKF